MDYIVFITEITCVFSITFFLLYNLMLIKDTSWFRKIPMFMQKGILGVTAGLISFCTIYIANFVFGLTNADGKNTIILVCVLFFGYEAAIIAGVTIVASTYFLNVFHLQTIIVQMILMVLLGIFMEFLIKRKGRAYVSRRLILFYLAAIPISLAATAFGGQLKRAKEVADDKLLLAIIILFVAFYSMMRLFLALQEKREQEIQLKENHHNLVYAYEELTALEEEVRLQMNQLLKSNQETIQREQVNQLLIRAGNVATWNLDLINKQFHSTESIQERLKEPIHEYEQLRHLVMETVYEQDKEKVALILDKIITGELDEIIFDYQSSFTQSLRWIRTKIVTLKNGEGVITNIAGSFADITGIKLKEEQLDHLANYDLLTELPNRHMLYQKLSNLERIKTNDKFTLIYLDLDNFKGINDTMGHATGDLLLQEIGKRLNLMVQGEQFIARIGGDEFALVIPETDKEDIIKFVTQVSEIINKKFSVGYMDYTISCSIGIAVYPEDGSNLDELMRASDIAMYHAKDSGKNGYAFFNVDLHEQYMEKLNLEKMLRDAIQNHEITAYFQPKYDSKLKIVGFEALARWISPIAGYISPSKFIPLAEQIGLIQEIRKQILLDSCDYISKINHLIVEDFEVSVNISTSEIMQDDFINSILSVVHQHNIHPRHIGIEITETTLMESFEITCDKLEYLRDKGIKISLDDFGTGYSSLNYLSQIPADIVKIDKSFIDKILSDSKYKMLTKTVIDLSHYLNIRTVAEGVEEKPQMNLLFELECDYIQGFYLGKPLTKEDAINLMSR